MESVKKSTGTGSDRISNALATLKREMVDLRQQDVDLMRQLITINETIHKLSKQRPDSNRPQKKKFALVSGRMIFVNSSESLPEETALACQTSAPNYCSRSGSLSGSLSSIEDTYSSTEDLSFADSDSDDSLFGSDQNSVSSTSRSRSVANPKVHVCVAQDIDIEYGSYEHILRRNVKLWKFSRSQNL